MAWPQAPQPAPGQHAPAGPSKPLDIGALITGIGALLTFLFSFVRIYKVDAFGGDTGWSVWTTDFFPGLFGVGTWIPFFALVAGALALGRAFAGLGDKEIVGFKVIQLQVVAVAFAVIQWFGFLISIVLSGSGPAGVDVEFGLGMLLLFFGLALVAGGTAFSMMGGKLPTRSGAPAPGVPGQWPAPTPPPGGPFAQPAPGQWNQPGAAPAPPPVDPNAWNQGQAAPHQGTPAPQPGQQQWPPAAPQPGQWQPDPAAGAPGGGQWPPPSAPSPYGQPPQAPQAPQAPPAPGQQPPGGGALIDPGTQVIPGPPPAPPADDPDQGRPSPPPPPGS